MEENPVHNLNVEDTRNRNRLDLQQRKFFINNIALSLLKNENTQQRTYGSIALTRGCDINSNKIDP